MDKKEKALFRYRLIAPLLDPDLKRGDRKELFNSISGKTHQLPNSAEVKFSRETIRSWYKKYRKSGFEGLHTKIRSDHGKPRTVSEVVAKKACDLKIEVPQRSLVKIISILEKEKIVEPHELSKSTLHRIFQAKQLTAKIPKEKGYWQRYQAEFPNDTWQSDQLFGPSLPDQNDHSKQLKTQLLAWLDDRSRVILHAQFFFDAKLPNLEHCLRKGIQKFGLPKKIYVDNGKIYTSKHLASICANLGIRLMLARPYCPEGKGKIERFFEYVRSSFLIELKVSHILTLEKLNEAFWAWLELEYHRRIHSQLKTTPMEVFMPHKENLRYPLESELKDSFLYRETRKIHKDCTFQLMGNYYEVMPALVHQEIEIRFDPYDIETVKIYLAGDFFQQSQIFRIPPQRREPKVIAEDAKVSTGINYLARLVDEHKEVKETFLFGPKAAASDGRFTLTDLLTAIERKGFHLSSFERNEIQKCFDTFGPFNKDQSVKTLENIVQIKGNRQHISFYLEKIVEAHQNRNKEKN